MTQLARLILLITQSQAKLKLAIKSHLLHPLGNWSSQHLQYLKRLHTRTSLQCSGLLLKMVF